LYIRRRPRLQGRSTQPNGSLEPAKAKQAGLRAVFLSGFVACFEPTRTASGHSPTLLSWFRGGTVAVPGGILADDRPAGQTDWVVDAGRVWLGFVFDNTRPGAPALLLASASNWELWLC